MKKTFVKDQLCHKKEKLSKAVNSRLCSGLVLNCQLLKQNGADASINIGKEPNFATETERSKKRNRREDMRWHKTDMLESEPWIEIVGESLSFSSLTTFQAKQPEW